MGGQPIRHHEMNFTSRKLNTVRNFIFISGSFLLNTLLSFATRTVFISLLSSEYLGVNGLFSNILSILSLAELGAGGAFVSLLYRPLANHDTEQLSSIMAAFQKVYFVISCTVGVVGVCLIPFLDLFTSGSTIPNLTLIFLLFLCNSMVTYFCAAKKALINADQKGYLITAYSQLAVIVQYVLQILVLFLTHNFMLYLCIQISCAIALNLYVSKKAKKIYPYLRKKAKSLTSSLQQEVRQKIAGGFCVHAGYIVASGTDSLVISHFLGLRVLGVYSNYLLIIGVVMKLSDMVINAVRASASNLVVSSSEEVNYVFFRRLNFLIIIMLGFFGTCLITLLNPFITVWVGIGYIMEMRLVVMAVIIYLSGWHGIKLSLAIYRNAMGLYYRDRYISLLEGCLNLVLSLLLVKPFGLAGVFLGTILSSVCTAISSAYLVYRYVFRRSAWEYWKTLIGYGLILTIVGCLVYLICGLIPHGTWLLFFMRASVCACLTLFCYLLIFNRTEEFKYFLMQTKCLLHHKGSAGC
jgi:O-antigen/teichoic acid export membrane protein